MTGELGFRAVMLVVGVVGRGAWRTVGFDGVTVGFCGTATDGLGVEGRETFGLAAGVRGAAILEAVGLGAAILDGATL